MVRRGRQEADGKLEGGQKAPSSRYEVSKYRGQRVQRTRCAVEMQVVERARPSSHHEDKSICSSFSLVSMG